MRHAEFNNEKATGLNAEIVLILTNGEAQSIVAAYDAYQNLNKRSKSIKKLKEQLDDLPIY